MTDFVYSGGVRFDDEAVADVTMDKDGHPLTCCNPITGECLGGGGSSDFKTITVTNKTGNTIYIEGVNAAGEAETEIADNASAQIVAGKFTYEGKTALTVQLLVCSASLISTGMFKPLGWTIGKDSTGVVNTAFGLGTIGAPVVECYIYVYCEQDANIVIVPSGTPHELQI